MSNITKTPSRNTELFSSLPPEVATVINDVIHSAYVVLGWHHSSKYLLTEILSRLAENDSFSQDHADFSAALWSHLEVKRRREKISRWIAKLKKDMELSRFFPIYIPKQVVIRTEEGGFKGQPTVYRIGHFWKLFRYVQDMALEINLLALPVNKRRAQVRVITAKWLDEAGAIKIIREKQEKPESSGKEQKEKAAKPCSCACAVCSDCLAGRAGWKPEPLPRPADRRVTKQMVERDVQLLFDRLVDYGQDWMNLNLRHQDFVRKALEEFNDAATRISKGVASHNKPGLKLVGGQPK